MKKELDNNFDSQNDPTFFVFTCVKDGRKYIGKLFSSLLTQTYTNFKHYIYEDGSNDPVSDLVDKYTEQVNNLAAPYKVIYEKNKANIGLNRSTKHCIDVCDCPYFVWIDCDNWMDSRFFENMVNFIKKNRDGIVYSSYSFRVIDGSGFTYSPYSNLYTRKRTKYGDKTMLLMSGLYSHSIFVVDYKKYLQMNPKNTFEEDRTITNDVQVLLNCSFSDYKFYFVPKSVGFQLMRFNSESKVEKITGVLDNYYLKKYIEYFDDENFAKDCIKLNHIIRKILSLDYGKEKRVLIKSKRRILRSNRIPIWVGCVEHNDMFFILGSTIFKPFIKLKRMLK